MSRPFITSKYERNEAGWIWVYFYVNASKAGPYFSDDGRYQLGTISFREEDKDVIMKGLKDLGWWGDKETRKSAGGGKDEERESSGS